ncbi:hypothetical protein QJ854_gp014 [Moumouvirus goulette]|uniref:Uncharacterized protein n=1 Tax=Moumouvirus goulette TaxID=1247379 RepID=M1PI36_9VIRU|nr:hypothetical protein QJ854_gp014 [Moumouvirus goulette]AGF85768.1 hypothetical protein glt_00965 [Moumouvirus goulette]
MDMIIPNLISMAGLKKIEKKFIRKFHYLMHQL